LHERIDDHDERARRPADLYARAAQGGDEESRDDRGEQPALGAYPARNREGDGERERHDPDDDPRAQIGEKLLAGVPREGGDELRNEPVQIPWPAGDAENLARSLLLDRKSTRLNSSHVSISYAVFCLKKKNMT